MRALSLVVSFFALGACTAPGPEVAHATQLSAVSQAATITGRDGGDSARLFGRTIFAFGDTVLAMPDAAGKQWHHNSISWTFDVNASDGITGFVEPLDAAGAPAYYIPASPFEQAYNDLHFAEMCSTAPCNSRWAVWASAPIWDAEQNVAFIPYAVLGFVADGPMLRGGGHSVARWSAFDQPIERPVIHPGTDHPDVIWTDDEPGWGTAGVIDHGYLHLFACGAGGLTRPCRLARAPTSRCQQRDAWQYWNGSDWTSDMGAVATLFDGGDIMGVSWNAHLHAWLAVFTPPLDHTVYARTAASLTGPWSDRTALYTAPGDVIPYDAANHAEFAEENGRVLYLTHSRPTTGWFGREFVLVRIELR